MLDPRVRTALLEFRAGRRTLEATAQTLAQVRRETGCLELHASASADEREGALLTRFAELAATRAADGAGDGLPGDDPLAI